MKSLKSFIVLGLSLGFSAAVVHADGKALYDSKCAMCHGKDGKGNPAMVKALGINPASLDLTKKETQDGLVVKGADVILKGQGKMKAVAGVTAEQAGEINTYVKSLAGGASAPASEIKKSESAPAAGGAVDLVKAAEIYKAKCQMCHGPSGKGNPAIATSMKLDVPLVDLTDKATTDKSDAELTKLTLDGVGKMPAYKGKISDSDANSLTGYIRQLSK